MSFEFHLPSLEDMRSTPAGLEMIRMFDEDDFRSALISGCPGSGKTTVSIYRLVRLNNQKVNVHLVTYQNLLVLAIQGLVNGLRVPAERVSTFHKWYCPLTDSRFDTDNPPSAEQMIESLQSSSLSREGLHEILIDEGQDLPKCVYQAIPRFASRCFVGADDSQQVHPGHGARMEEIEQSLHDDFGPYRRFTLGRNFRNTYETYRFARQFISRTNLVAWDESLLERLLHANCRGPKPTVITYRDSNTRDEHLRTTLQNAEGNIAILCPHGKQPKNGGHSGESVDDVFELVSGMGFKASKYRSGADTPLPQTLEKYIVTTFKSAKGLEFDTVIIPRINNFKNIPAEWYVASTRARRKLFIYRNLDKPFYDPIVQLDFDPDSYDSVSLEEEISADTSTIPF